MLISLAFLHTTPHHQRHLRTPAQKPWVSINERGHTSSPRTVALLGCQHPACGAFCQTLPTGPQRGSLDRVMYAVWYLALPLPPCKSWLEGVIGEVRVGGLTSNGTLAGASSRRSGEVGILRLVSRFDGSRGVFY